MDNLQDPILNFPPDTVNVIRKTYNLDKPGAMDSAIDILELWLKKQDHFTKKDFSRDYLERCIIRSKGSVERAKERLDALCTARTLMPEFFPNRNIRDFKLDMLMDVALPKLTNDYYRVFIMRNTGQEFTTDFFIESAIREARLVEYLLAHDYCNGLIAIIDITQTNLMEMLKKIDLVMMTNITSVFFKAYSLRVKAIHIISTSKMVNAFVTIFKQAVSEKIGNRIQVHKNYESLYEHIDRAILPKEFGGDEISIKELHEKWLDALTTESFTEYMKMMNAANTDEKLRQSDAFSNQYLGTPGTFRSFNVD